MSIVHHMLTFDEVKLLTVIMVVISPIMKTLPNDVSCKEMVLVSLITLLGSNMLWSTAALIYSSGFLPNCVIQCLIPQ